MVSTSSVENSTLVEDFMNTRMITMNSKDSVLDIAKRMVEGNVSSVAITDDNQTIIGILTERDIVKIIANKIPPEGITSGSLMSTPIFSIKNNIPIEEAAQIMREKKVRHLLVINAYDYKVMGMITVTDFARYLKQKLVEAGGLASSEAWELFF
jgi:CBS domain-containing protein